MDFQGCDEHWFALQVKVRGEHLCAAILRNKGYEGFLPTHTVARDEKGSHLHRTPQPLFPGYVFCRLSPNARGPVLTTPGVIRVVGYGGVPSPISNEEIDSIQCMLACSRAVYPYPYLRLGERVRITAGPLAGVEGTLLRLKNVDRLVVSVDVLRRSVAVELDVAWVVSACPVSHGGDYETTMHKLSYRLSSQPT